MVRFDTHSGNELAGSFGIFWKLYTLHKSFAHKFFHILYFVCLMKSKKDEKTFFKRVTERLP